ncbi:SDR family oxidoreductase [Membranicola marinus]|uniref:SDR family oxidoreductase n=1 Tax=Membranihabitans marinus TaxID=1227546 RepID=A0A953L7I0_9BACT|nr:SDR family oxidoreductase [Membranihabitans marinus]MBY5956625.1 SDR family oxidoreductase [Membranihabitans marinus]
MHILLTGGAGFIGSHLVRAFIDHPEITHTTIVDNLITGSMDNIREVLDHDQVTFVEGDIRDLDLCQKLCNEATAVCHQAALGSVPRSVDDPVRSNAHNIDGTLNIFMAARQNNIKRVVFASSSSVYGDDQNLPKVESRVGQPLSPYAITKKVAELYAENFGRLYGMELIGLRYFNIFGPRQSPKGPYAAVIPLFIKAIRDQEAATINGDGSFSRDFTYVDNAVQANLRGLLTNNPAAVNQNYNVACGERTTLTELWGLINDIAGSELNPIYGPERAGDIPHSLADISKAQELLDYEPTVGIREGLERLMQEQLR